jgi:hypothetical protein
MSKKRRKAKARSGYRAPAGAAAPVTERAVPASRSRPTRTRAEAPSALGFLSRGNVDSPFPPIPQSIARGALAVGSSLVLLVTAFVLEFVLWVGLVALGLEGPPGRLVNLLALPPISTYFDALNGVTIYGFGGAGFGAATAFIVVRSLVLAVVVGLVVETLEGGGSPLEGVRRGLVAFPTVLVTGILALSLMIVGSVILPVLGPGLGFLGSVLTLVAALFFLVYAPVAAVREGRPIQETIRRSARAAMMPGSRHLLFCMFYIFLALPILVALAPSGNLLGVNPSIAMWAYGLITTFVHLTFLAAFAYRWIQAEDEVPDQPVRARRAR